MFDPLKEFGKVESIGHAAMDWGDGASENMIVPMKNPEPFDGEHIEIVFHNTEYIFFTSFVCTDGTDGPISVGESEADSTLVNISLQFLQFASKVFYIRSISFQQKKREFHCGFFADSGHIGDEVDEALESFWHYLLKVKCESLSTRYPGFSTLSIFSIMELEVRVSRDSASAIRILIRFSSKVRFFRVISRFRMLYPFVALILRTHT